MSRTHITVPLGHKTRALTPREQDEMGRRVWLMTRAMAGEPQEWDDNEPGRLMTPRERARVRASWEALSDEERDYYAELARQLVCAAFCLVARPPNMVLDATIAEEASA